MSIITSGVGRIGKDATTRHTQGGESVTGFSLAMDNGFGDKKQTLWFDASGWGKRYEAVAPYLLKGTQVFVSGELGEREHDGKTYKTLRLNDLQLVGGKLSGERQVRQDPQPDCDDFDSDTIPF
jgi:single-strand DNA-binding protein